MIIFNNLSKAYYGKNYVVTNLNLKINPGEIIGLIGHNGAEKTTTFYSLYIDTKNPNFAWFNSKDLVDDFLKNFKIIGFSALLYIPSYLLNIIFKENYMLTLLPTLFNIYLLVTTYNKLKIKMKNIFCCK